MFDHYFEDSVSAHDRERVADCGQNFLYLHTALSDMRHIVISPRLPVEIIKND